jgi:hypothetical protein
VISIRRPVSNKSECPAGSFKNDCLEGNVDGREIKGDLGERVREERWKRKPKEESGVGG